MNIAQEKVEKEYAAGRAAALTRMLPLAGVVYAFLTIAGYSTIGEFPDASTPPSGLAAFYRDHHANVVTGGRLLEWSAVCFALFAIGLAARVQRSSTIIASLILVGAAVETVADGFSGAVYTFLGGVGGDGHLSPSALQAVHAWGAEFGMGAGTVVFAIGVVAATFLTRAIPAWLGWSAVVLGVAQLTSVGFYASLLFLAWAIVAGIAMALRPMAGGHRAARPPTAAHA